MNYIIESDNQFLKIAFEYISDEMTSQPSICIIDLGSMNSLTDIMTCISKYNEEMKFVVIGSDCIYSKVLSDIVFTVKKMSARHFHRQITLYPKLSKNEISKKISDIKKLKSFNYLERHTIYSLLTNASMIKAAKHIGIRPKAFYLRINGLTKKFNLSNQNHFQYFIKTEIEVERLRDKLFIDTKHMIRDSIWCLSNSL